MIITIIMMTMTKVLIPAWSRLTEADSAMGWISVQQVWTRVVYIRFCCPFLFVLFVVLVCILMFVLIYLVVECVFASIDQFIVELFSI